jgi:hypothetical protein
MELQLSEFLIFNIPKPLKTHYNLFGESNMLDHIRALQFIAKLPVIVSGSNS